eukprot:Lankesteria_metandrocarpae@DN6361_c0_g1_i1.p1
MPTARSPAGEKPGSASSRIPPWGASQERPPRRRSMEATQSVSGFLNVDGEDVPPSEAARNEIRAQLMEEQQKALQLMEDRDDQVDLARSYAQRAAIRSLQNEKRYREGVAAELGVTMGPGIAGTALFEADVMIRTDRVQRPRASVHLPPGAVVTTKT